MYFCDVIASRHAQEAQHFGFWRNPKRFNVAITRAKALLVVVGHPLVLVEVPPQVFSKCSDIVLHVILQVFVWFHIFITLRTWPAVENTGWHGHRPCLLCLERPKPDIVVMQEASWRELVRFCAARGAYRGAGAGAMASVVRSSAMSNVGFPGLVDGPEHDSEGVEHSKSDVVCTRIPISSR